LDTDVLRRLAVDSVGGRKPRSISNAVYSKILPTPLSSPTLVVSSRSALALIGIDCAPETISDFAEYFCGNKILPGSQPAAHRYCGHQFGNYAGQLGDGAALYLGDISGVELQLKGSGKTPFSRGFDGRKVLRSSLREFLASEAMHSLGIPSTRSATVVTSRKGADSVLRDRGKPEACTVITRSSPTFFRFGSFQGLENNHVLLRDLAEYTRSKFYNACEDGNAMFNEILRRSAQLVAKWQSVGFCHGVLNTDNMSIIGVTLDYGPYGFMEWFDRDYICNASDKSGRYAYHAQPDIVKWNLGILGECLIEGKVCTAEAVAASMDNFQSIFEEHFYSLMTEKLGVPTTARGVVDSLLDVMHKTSADFTMTQRQLAEGNWEDCPPCNPQATKASRARQCFVPRIPLSTIQQLLAQPNDFANIFPGAPPQEVERELRKLEKMHLKASLAQKEACELTDVDKSTTKNLWKTWFSDNRSVRKRQGGNLDRCPTFILRQWVAQDVYEAAEDEDYSKAVKVLENLQNPFDAEPKHNTWTHRPHWADHIAVT